MAGGPTLLLLKLHDDVDGTTLVTYSMSAIYIKKKDNVPMVKEFLLKLSMEKERVSRATYKHGNTHSYYGTNTWAEYLLFHCSGSRDFHLRLLL